MPLNNKLKISRNKMPVNFVTAEEETSTVPAFHSVIWSAVLTFDKSVITKICKMKFCSVSNHFVSFSWREEEFFFFLTQGSLNIYREILNVRKSNAAAKYALQIIKGMDDTKSWIFSFNNHELFEHYVM